MQRTALELDEAALFDRCKRGEERALTALIQRYEQSIFGMALCLTGCSREVAYELAVHSFMEAVHGLAEARTVRSFWQIALPALIERARTVKPAPVHEPPAIPGIPPEHQERLRVVQRALLTLPFDERLLLLLREQLHLRYDAMAALLSQTTPHIKASTIQARMQLRGHLRDALDRIR